MLVEYESRVSELETTNLQLQKDAETAEARILHLEQRWSKTRAELRKAETNHEETEAS